jgi:hypothetical protein
MVLVLDLSRCITIGSQDEEGQETIITRSRMKISGRGDHNIMRATVPTILMLSKEDPASDLRDQKGRLRELRRSTESTDQNELRGRKRLNGLNE